MSTKRERINEERELLNYEPTHLYNIARHKGVTLNVVKSTSVLVEDLAEYGVMLFDENGKKKKTVKFSSLERCQIESQKISGSMVVRLGRNHRLKSFDSIYLEPINKPIGSFLAQTDESGNIDTSKNEVVPDVNVFKLISNALVIAGYPNHSGARPPAELLRSIAMRYNDIVPEDFAAAVVKHCELPKISEGEDKSQGKSPFKSPEEKEAWYDTPAGLAWVKEHPIPPIFNFPTPEFIHRRG